MSVVTKFLTNSNGKMLVDSATGKPLSLTIDVVNGTDGVDGDSVFIRYSASPNGSNMTAAPAENTRYIGFYRGQSASNTASDYTWSQYVGKEISEVTIDEFSFVITYDDGTTSTAPLNTDNCLVTYAVPSDEATAMAAYLVPSNADLNDYRGENYWGKTFYAGGSNTVQNTPVAGIAFSLEVMRSGAFATVQRITMMAAGSNNQPTVYTRSVSDTTTTGGEGSWTAWTEVAEANGTYSNMAVGNSTNAMNAINIIPDESGAVNPLGRKADSVVGENSTALGYNSTASGDSSTALGYSSTAVGDASIALGRESRAGGTYSAALGYYARATGQYSTVLGNQSTASGEHSTALGYFTYAAGDGSTAIGAGASLASSLSNTMLLGGSGLSALRCAVNLTVTSDKRDKTDIEDITDALAFVERLNPVTFVSNDRESYISDEDKKGETFRKYGMCEYDRASHAAGTKKGERRRCGLLAQEVVEAMQSVYGTANYANVVNDNFHDLEQKPSDVENKYTLAYANLVPFLIGAIKELNAKINALESKLAISNGAKQG